MTLLNHSTVTSTQKQTKGWRTTFPWVSRRKHLISTIMWFEGTRIKTLKHPALQGNVETWSSPYNIKSLEKWSWFGWDFCGFLHWFFISTSKSLLLPSIKKNKNKNKASCQSRTESQHCREPHTGPTPAAGSYQMTSSGDHQTVPETLSGAAESPGTLARQAQHVPSERLD